MTVTFAKHMAGTTIINGRTWYIRGRSVAGFLGYSPSLGCYRLFRAGVQCKPVKVRDFATYQEACTDLASRTAEWEVISPRDTP